MLIECVPNFSEGRDKARVDAIIGAMLREGVYLLDREMDADHNRSVVTLVGERGPLLEAALAGIGKAAELIDLNVQRGAHPRLGATDVVPFIPIADATLEDCVQMARELGRQVWERYKIPVYFYEAAATRPERANLENIRRGQFEAIREEIATVESRRPDVGEPRCHPTAGAVVIGARNFLVAYNVYLQTVDVEIAKKVAKAVRFSSGGLRAVKAIGLEVRGQAQVSMNLTDTSVTPMARVFEFVRREAARYGVLVQSSEIVGLVPKRALEDAAAWFLQVENFDPSMILENRIAVVMGRPGAEDTSSTGSLRAGIEPFLNQLAAPTAVPGGGSAAAATAAMAAALGIMVAEASRSKKAYASFAAELSESTAKLKAIGEQLRAAIDADAESYHAVLVATKARRVAREAQLRPSTPTAGALGTPSADETAMSAAEAEVAASLRQATGVPLRVAQRANELRALLQELGPRTNPNMGSDLKTAMSLARAAMEGALANVEINLEALEAQSGKLNPVEATGVRAFIAESRALISGLWTILHSAE